MRFVVSSSRSMFLSPMIIASALIIGTGLGIYWVIPTIKADQRRWIPPAQGDARIKGQSLYKQHCATCHGMQLEGQFNWRERQPNGRLPAPPHDDTGHTWHHPDLELVQMIRYGFVPGVNAPPNYQSDMPAYAGILSDDEIVSILGYIKSNWSSRALEAQREITLKSKQNAGVGR